MARVRLSVRGVGSSPGTPYYRPEDRSGTVYHIPRPRLFVKLAVLPRDAIDAYRPDDLPNEWTPDAVLDTGAPITLFPFPLWQPFRDVIRWLDQPPAAGLRQVTVLGGRFTYRLGRVRFGAFDAAANWLPAVWTNAWFLDADPAAPKQVVLGLRTRLFDGRQLRCEVVPAEPLGQVWWLEDAAPPVSR
jgi:hypothetical protein